MSLLMIVPVSSCFLNSKIRARICWPLLHRSRLAWLTAWRTLQFVDVVVAWLLLDDQPGLVRNHAIPKSALLSPHLATRLLDRKQPLFMAFFVLYIFIFVYEKIFLFSCIGRLCDYKISCYAERLKEAEGIISFICLMKKMFQIFFCIYSRQTGLTNRNDLLTLLSYPLN